MRLTRRIRQGCRERHAEGGFIERQLCRLCVGSSGNRVILPRMKIAELEHSTDWQATAEDKNKRQIAVMRTNKGKYHLYDGNWTATPYPNSYQFPEGRAAHSGHEVKAMFASGKLKLLKGTIPD